MNVEPPETLMILESIVYKSNGFAIYLSALSVRPQRRLRFAKKADSLGPFSKNIANNSIALGAK